MVSEDGTAFSRPPPARIARARAHERLSTSKEDEYQAPPPYDHSDVNEEYLDDAFGTAAASQGHLMSSSPDASAELEHEAHGSCLILLVPSIVT